MATWHTPNGDKQEKAALHDATSSTSYDLGSRGKSSPFQSPPLRTYSQAPRLKRRCVRLCAVATFVVIVILACAIAIPLALKNNKHSGSLIGDDNLLALSDACNVTLYPTVCYDSLSNLTGGNLTSNPGPQQWVQLSLEAAMDSVTRDLTTAQILYVTKSRDTNTAPQVTAVFHDCIEFTQASLDSVGQTLNGLKSFSVANLDDDIADLRTWMSASLTTQETCLDGVRDLDLAIVNGSVADFVQQGEFTSMLLSNVLAFISTLRSLANGIPNIPGHRRLLTSNEATATYMKRRHLATSASTTTVVVALDGSGDYRRIMDAMKYAPQNTSGGSSHYMIHIKAGMYLETVVVPKNAYNVVIQGEGMGKTKISGSLSVTGSNVTTSSTATLTVQGTNFVGRDFTVENTAGAANHQAVAVRVTGDYAAFEMCEFSGFQDTLYTHTNRQFYSHCTIRGTVDFIFGNAAAVFQSSQIIATTGLIGQQNTYTASGRTDPNQNTGITFQNCTFDGSASLNKAAKGTFLTYLGRPWKDYARTVVIESVETSILNPAGWLDWNGSPQDSTVYYGEYQNTGPGFSPSSRVTWSKQIDQSTANTFTVDKFIQGKKWLPQANITYIASV